MVYGVVVILKEDQPSWEDNARHSLIPVKKIVLPFNFRSKRRIFESFLFFLKPISFGVFLNYEKCADVGRFLENLGL